MARLVTPDWTRAVRLSKSVSSTRFILETPRMMASSCAMAPPASDVAPEALVTSEGERRAFETDALTAYRKMPLAVVLPSTTQEVSAVLKFCHQHGVKVVPRGAGVEQDRPRSRCGG